MYVYVYNIYLYLSNNMKEGPKWKFEDFRPKNKNKSEKPCFHTRIYHIYAIFSKFFPSKSLHLFIYLKK
jgi:hypothetical protein